MYRPASLVSLSATRRVSLLHRCGARMTAPCAAWVPRTAHRWRSSISSSTQAAQLSHHHSTNTTALADLRALLDAKSARLAVVRETQQLVHAEAHCYPDRYMLGIWGFLVLQYLVLFDWTYVHFDWNLVEPITYLLGYAATWIALAWYGNMQQEFGLDTLREYLEHKKIEKVFKECGFSVDELVKLELEVGQLQKMVSALEME